MVRTVASVTPACRAMLVSPPDNAVSGCFQVSRNRSSMPRWATDADTSQAGIAVECHSNAGSRPRSSTCLDAGRDRLRTLIKSSANWRAFQVLENIAGWYCRRRQRFSVQSAIDRSHRAAPGQFHGGRLPDFHQTVRKQLQTSLVSTDLIEQLTLLRAMVIKLLNAWNN